VVLPSPSDAAETNMRELLAELGMALSLRPAITAMAE
jgi:hypothetical protein